MTIIQHLKEKLKIDPKILVIYIVLYYLWGFAMNEVGIYAEIARFKYRFQILICYVFFMIPVSLVLRKLPWYSQYAYGLVLMGFYEFGGYAFQSSIAYDGNLIEQTFGIRNFSLAMTLFFGLYFPAGNYAVGKIASFFNLKDD